MATRLAGSELQSNQNLLFTMSAVLIKTHKRLEKNIFHVQTTQGNVPIFKEVPLRRAKKQTNTTFEMKTRKKKQQKTKSKELSFLLRKTALGWRSGDGVWRVWTHFECPGMAEMPSHTLQDQNNETLCKRLRQTRRISALQWLVIIYQADFLLLHSFKRPSPEQCS